MRDERRYHLTKPVLDRCRLCWFPMTPDPRQVEMGEERVYYRCPRCLGSFPIRRSDLASMNP